MTEPSGSAKNIGLTPEEIKLSEQFENKPTRRNTDKAQTGGGSIVAAAQKRTQIAKRESMAQAVQDGREANRVYAETFLTVLEVGANEFSDSLTLHLGGMRESLLEVEDDADFLQQLMANGCGGTLPS